MKHLQHALLLAFIALLAQVPAILASPAAQNVITNHPWIAAYVPVATGLAAALYKGLKEKADPAWPVPKK